MSLLCRPVDITMPSLTSSTVSDGSTVWGYALAAVVNVAYFDPGTRHLYKALQAGVSSGSIAFSSFADTVTWNTHGRANGDVFAFSGGTAPTGLSPSTPYFIVNQTTNTFQLSLTPDGEVINFTSDGSGTTGYINAAFDNAAAWQDRGPTNRWRMFDKSNRTATEFSSSCQIVVAPSSRVDSIAAMAMTNVSEIYIAATGTGSVSRTNHVLRSQEFDNAGWTKTNMNVTANSARAIDGTVTMDRIVPTTTNAAHTVSQAVSPGGGTCTFSVYLKAAGYTKAAVTMDGGGGNSVTATVDLTAKTVIGSSAGAWTATVAAEWLGDGSARISVTAAVTSITAVIGVLNAAGLSSFAGNGASGIYAWGAQVELSVEPTSYLPTAGSTVTSAADSRFEYRSLVDASFNDWFAGYYSEPVYRRDDATSLIPPLPSQSITVTLISPGAGSIGSLIFALSKDIGKAEYDSHVGTRTFSDTGPDIFGNINPIIRGSAKQGNFTVALKERNSDAVKALIEQCEAIPQLWLMAPEAEETGFQWKQRGIIYGLGKNWDFQFWQPSDDKYQLELEGYA